jgi:NitT/TauT family transport system substrate-binding protein
VPSPLRSDLSRRRFLGLGAGLGAAVLLGGCGDDEAASVARAGAAGSSASALEPYTVRTCVYAKNHASSALYWQQFAPEGIHVEVVPVKSAIEVQDGLESGQLDFGLLAPYTPIIALAQDPASISSKIIGMISRGGLGLVGRKGEIETVEDLRGRKLAVPPPTLQVLVLNDALREARLTLGEDVEAVPLGFADHVLAFERGDVDAFMGTEPLVTQAVVAGSGVRLREVEQTPVGDFNTANWASAKVLRERPDVVRAAAQMQKDAAQFLSPDGENDPQRWRELLVDQFGFAVPVYEQVLDHIGARWKFDEERVAQVEAAATMLVQQGGIAREPELEPLFAREYWDV